MSRFARRFQFASNASSLIRLYLTPSNGSYNVNDTLAVEIYEDSLDVAVNTVQANLNYPASLLQFESIDTTGSPFTTTVEKTGGGGSVKLGVGVLSGSVTGVQLVGTVTFTVLAVGTADITFASGSGIAAYDTSTDVCQAKDGAQYVIT